MVAAFFLLALALTGMSGQRYLFIENLERLALDWRMQGIGYNAPSADIVIVQGGEESLRRLGIWPWPRSTHAALLSRLGHARLVVMDILFPEPSEPSYDQALADVARTMGNVVTAMHIAPASQTTASTPVAPFPALAEAAKGIGLTNVEEDIDGLIRHHTPVRLIAGEAYPSLALAAAMELRGETPSLEETKDGLTLTMGDRRLPLDETGNLLLDLSRPAFPTYEYADVLHGQIPPETFKDKVIVVGIAASGVEDFHIVPAGLAKRVLEGTQYNAMAMETILASRVPMRISQTPTMALVFFLVLLGGAAALPRHPLLGAGLVASTAIVYTLINISIFKESLFWLDFVFPMFALAVAHIFAAFIRYAILHRDWRLKTYSLSSLYSLEAASKDHASLGDFLEEVWPQFKAGSGVDLLTPQAALESTTSDVRRAVRADLETAEGLPRVVILRSNDLAHSRKMALPVPAGDGSGTFKYTVLGWQGRLAEDTSRTLAVTILSAAWFYRTLSRSREKRKLLTETIRAIFRALDFRDPITGGHSDRVATLAMEVLKEMNVDDETREDVHLGALIHDIGKIGIPDSVLGKPDKLTGEEFGLILKHPAIGDEIMGSVPLPEASKRTMAEHHERFDGSGYPKGISGENLSLGARIVAVADVFDALCSDRPYRKGLSVDQVCDYISKGSGTKYDPQVVEIVLRLKAPANWEPGNPPPEMKGETKDEK